MSEDGKVMENLEDLAKCEAEQEAPEPVEINIKPLVAACSMMVDGKHHVNMFHGDTTEIVWEAKLEVEEGNELCILVRVNGQKFERLKLGVGETFSLKHVLEFVSPAIESVLSDAGLKLEEKEE